MSWSLMEPSSTMENIQSSIFLDGTSNLLHLGRTGCIFFGMYLWQRLYLITDMRCIFVPNLLQLLMK